MFIQLHVFKHFHAFKIESLTIFVIDFTKLLNDNVRNHKEK